MYYNFYKELEIHPYDFELRSIFYDYLLENNKPELAAGQLYQIKNKLYPEKGKAAILNVEDTWDWWRNTTSEYGLSKNTFDNLKVTYNKEHQDVSYKEYETMELAEQALAYAIIHERPKGASDENN